MVARIVPFDQMPAQRSPGISTQEVWEEYQQVVADRADAEQTHASQHYDAWKQEFDKGFQRYLKDSDRSTLTPATLERDMRRLENQAWQATLEKERDQRHIDRTEGLSYPETREEHIAAAWARLDAYLEHHIPAQPRAPQVQEHKHEQERWRELSR